MADVHSKEIRSYNMSQIKGRNTKPEMLVRRFLFANGFRYKLHDKKLPGKPDIVLPKYKTVIFVHGCFWHGHTYCKYYVVPKTRTDWWLNKINGNITNDAKVIGKSTQIDPLLPEQTDPLAPFQTDPLIPAETDPLKEVIKEQLFLLNKNRLF